MCHILCSSKQIGKFHKIKNKRCEDAVSAKQYPFGTVMAVSDGVGSKRYARIGANAAVNAVQKSFCDFSENIVEFEGVPERIKEYYMGAISPKKLTQADATCLFAAHIYERGLYLGQIGDGLVICQSKKEVVMMRESKSGFSNFVTPLNWKTEKDQWRLKFIPEHELNQVFIALMTDGISEEIMPEKETAFANRLIEKLNGKEKQNTILRSMLRQEIAPYSIDDKALAVYAIQKEN